MALISSIDRGAGAACLGCAVKTARSLAGLFSVCLVAACSNSNAPDVSNNPPPPPSATNRSMQFFGTGVNDIDRVKIPLLNANATARPVNIGATDFTIEFWIKGTVGNNPTPSCAAGRLGNGAWLNGAVVIDRDVLGDGDFGEFGIALLGGQVAFGVSRGAAGATACGGTNVLDGMWHHVAVTRQLQTGQMKIFVDGGQDALVTDAGASLDVSYNPAHAVPDANDPFLVLGAQKRDDLAARPFRGLIDELRVSTMLRYTGTGQRPTAAFTLDGNTAALYHFDETSGTDVLDDNGNLSPGLLLPGPQGAAAHRSTDVPF